jgi:flavin reductase (DIM6/NTAB) family NADH-FMN oxidoreductase RutF
MAGGFSKDKYGPGNLALSVNETQFKDALSRYATGVTVVTGMSPEGRPVGVTVSSFTSLSLIPPLVLFCLAKTVSCLPAFTESERFAINILGEGQRDLSVAFATQSPDKFQGIDYTLEDGLPILKGCLATLHCRRRDVHEGGDHLIIVGEVETSRVAPDGAPLVYHRGAYRRARDAF